MRHPDLPGMTLWAVPRFRRHVGQTSQNGRHDARAKTDKDDKNTVSHRLLIQYPIQAARWLTHKAQP